MPRTAKAGHTSGLDWHREYKYQIALRDFRFFLTKAGIDASRYGLHSLRSSGATHYLTHGLTVAELCRIGLWNQAESIAPYDRRAHDSTIACRAMSLLGPAGATGGAAVAATANAGGMAAPPTKKQRR